MLLSYAAWLMCGIGYGILFTMQTPRKPLWITISSAVRLLLATLFIYYLLQLTQMPPILGGGIFLAGMWLWILIHIR